MTTRKDEEIVGEIADFSPIIVITWNKRSVIWVNFTRKIAEK
jgi:hypothetical protein